MTKYKVCVDIGGTKTIFAAVDERLRLKDHVYKASPKTIKDFINLLEDNMKAFSRYSDVINISLAGRTDKDGRIVYCANLPLKNFNIKKMASKYFKKVSIDNDANCFAVYEIFRGALKKIRDGVILVWGTGVGGAIVSNRKILRGMGFASEIGHMRTMSGNEEDIEHLIGGKWIEDKYGHTGLELHQMAEVGNKRALAAFEEIGKTFGLYLVSLSYMLDPQIVVLGGSFVNSWKFIKDSVNDVIQNETIRGKLKIKVVRGKFYVIKGCYFLDEYEKIYNKL